MAKETGNGLDICTVVEDVHGKPTTGRVPFSLILLKAQEFVGVVNIRVAKIFDIAETHTCVEAEDEGISHVLFLKLIVGIHELLDFLL